jgi:hypothetical protein
MTRKDYEAIAKIVRSERTLCDPYTRQESRDIIDHLTYALSDVLADDNPKFHREQFLAACAYGTFDD